MTSQWSRPQHVPPSSSHYGRATVALCVVFALVYLVECWAAGSLMSVSAPVLGQLGGNVAAYTFGQGQYWRLVTAALMHGGLLHIGFNTYAMLLIGSALERTLGVGWMVGPFVFSAITGSLLSGLANPANVVAIGASGGIFGLVAMAATLSYLAPQLTGFSRSVLVQWLLFSLMIGVVGGFDNWGHIGGILGGAICAFVVAQFKRTPSRARRMGKAVGAIGVVVMAVSVLAAIQFQLATLRSMPT